MTRAPDIIAIGALLALLSACSSTAPANGPSGAPPERAVTQADLDALAPDRLRIHPLTRITRETTPQGPQTQLACHLELKDKFGHSVKALGRVRVELYHPGTAEPGGAMSETQDLIWELDLRDPDKNALLYDDMVTRTYAIHLGGLPEWVVRWSAGESREPWVTLKATFNAIDCKGGEHRLESTYRLQK